MKGGNIDFDCIKIPGTEEITFNKQMIGQSVKTYWETLGKANMNLNDCNSFLTNRLVHQIRNNLSYEYDSNNEEFLYDIVIDSDIVEKAISLAKNNKAPGLDSITNELLKNGGYCITATLLILIQNY